MSALHKLGLSIFGLLLAGVVVSARADANRTGRIRLDLVPAPCEQFPGDTTCKEFFVQLPSHIDFPSGSEVALDFACEPTLLSLISQLAIQVNDRPIWTFSLDAKNPADGKLRVSAQLPPRALQAGWNRITAHFLFRKTAEINQDLLKNFTWSAERAGSGLVLAYERMEQFPELRLFPKVSAQEKLIQSDPAAPPAFAILLPSRRRDAHLRACAVVGARLGQVGYLSDRDCRIASLENWQGEIESTSGLLVGCKDELPLAGLPSNFQTKLADLKPGQGLLGEFITGNLPNQRRWIVVSGADDAGLEKAVLTLGSTPALTELAPGPAVVEQAPARQAPVANALGEAPALQQLNSILIRDSSLQKTVFLLSRKADLEELKALFDLALYLGRQLPHSPVLWPDACAWSPTTPPPPDRMQGRSVVLLAPLAEWKNALPPRTRLGVEMPAEDKGLVRMQGRPHRLATFETSLVFLHLLPSPWTQGEQLVAAGGFLNLSPTLLKTIIQSAAPAGKLYGNLCALDAAGRIVAYDTRHPRLESFASLVQQQIPAGLTVEETNRRLQDQARLSQKSAHFNRTLSYVAGIWLILLATGRVLLLWEKEWRRRRATRYDQPLGSMT